MDKQELGINGEHTHLGREVDNAEFKGFTIATLQAIKTDIQEIKNEKKTQDEQFLKHCEAESKKFQELFKRVGKVERFQTRLIGLAIGAGAGVGAFAGQAGDFLTEILSKLFKII